MSGINLFLTPKTPTPKRRSGDLKTAERYRAEAQAERVRPETEAARANELSQSLLQARAEIDRLREDAVSPSSVRHPSTP